MTTHKVLVSRDVVFKEHHFPYFFKNRSQSPFTSFYLSVNTPPSFDTDMFPSPTAPCDASNATSLLPVPPITSRPPPSIQSTSTSLPPPTFPTVSTDSFPSPTHFTPRRSLRSHQPPSHLKDYICHTSTTHWCNIVHFHSLPSHHQAFNASKSVWKEPSSYKKAALSEAWQAAMNTEIEALEKNNTWDLVPLPPGKKAIGSKWVYKVKLKADGSLERFKARFVAKVPDSSWISTMLFFMVIFMKRFI